MQDTLQSNLSVKLSQSQIQSLAVSVPKKGNIELQLICPANYTGYTCSTNTSFPLCSVNVKYVGFYLPHMKDEVV